MTPSIDGWSNVNLVNSVIVLAKTIDTYQLKNMMPNIKKFSNGNYH